MARTIAKANARTNAKTIAKTIARATSSVSAGLSAIANACLTATNASATTHLSGLTADRWTRLQLPAWLTLAMVCAPQAWSQNSDEADAAHHALTPYEAVYKTSTSGLSIKLRRSLSMDDNGDCRLTSNGKLLVAGIDEVSVFTVNGERVVPKSYVYQLSGPVSRRREVHFDGDSDVIRSLYKKKWYELPNGGDTLDRMSQQEQFRLLFLNDPTPREDVVFSVADGRKIKEYRFVFRGEERLETPMGWVNTLRFEREHRDPERRSEVWIAPSWDYLMVRTVHIEDGKTTEANLISASIAGAPVAGISG